jgi:outer membrane protein assembly factor BamB
LAFTHLARLRLVLSLLPVLLLLATDANAEDWPQFRGPERNGLSAETGLLKAWPKGEPALEWKCEGVGIGYSSVAVVAGQVFTMGDLKDGCYLIAIDRDKGTVNWKTKVGKTGGNYRGPRCTPSVDGQSVYGLGQFGDLVCLDVNTGAERWRKNLKNDFKGREGGWNYTESPLVDGPKLLVTPGGQEAALLALDKKDGTVIWKGAIPGGDQAGYSSIVVAEFGGVRQYVQLMANGLVGFSADRGELLWRYGMDGKRFGGNTANIPTPIVQGDQIFASAGYGRGGALVTVSSAGGKLEVKEEYWNKNLNNRHGGVLLVGDRLYGDRDDSGRLWCADFKTGAVKWVRGSGSKGNGSAALTHADGMLYVRFANGWVALVDPKDGYNEVSGFQVPNGTNDCWAHPVVAGGKLFIREKDVVWCYDVKGK